jgi:hypothetical protein
MNKFFSITAFAGILLAAGCESTEPMTADFTVPPRVITNLESIDTLEIVPNVTLSGSAFQNKAAGKQLIDIVLQQSLASRLYQNGYIRVVDSIWGNVDGASQLDGIFNKKDSLHGYARITTDSIEERARLELDLNLVLNSDEKEMTVENTLADVPYDIKYRQENREIKTDTGRRDQNGHRIYNRTTRTVRVPYSEAAPSRTTYKTVTTKMPVFTIAGKGTLSAKLVDKSGKTVYEKVFPDFACSFQSPYQDAESQDSVVESSLNVSNALVSALADALDGNNSEQPKVEIKRWNGKARLMPTCSEVIAQMIFPALEEIVKDISPYRESRTVEFRTDASASERPVLLLRAKAFMEALDAMDGVADMSSADYLNQGVAYEAIGEYLAAKDAYDEAVRMKPNSESAAASKKRIDAVLADRERMREANAKKLDTQFESDQE